MPSPVADASTVPGSVAVAPSRVSEPDGELENSLTVALPAFDA